MRRQHVAVEAQKIALVEREIVDMALAGIAKLALRAALAAPVHCRDREVAAHEIADGLVVFLDIFRAAAEQDDGSARALRRPARRAQPHAVERGQLVLHGAGRGRIVGDGVKRHAAGLPRR